jgi:hypothetical protein
MGLLNMAIETQEEITATAGADAAVESHDEVVEILSPRAYHEYHQARKAVQSKLMAPAPIAQARGTEERFFSIKVGGKHYHDVRLIDETLKLYAVIDSDSLRLDTRLYDQFKAALSKPLVQRERGQNGVKKLKGSHKDCYELKIEGDERLVAQTYKEIQGVKTAATLLVYDKLCGHKAVDRTVKAAKTIQDMLITPMHHGEEFATAAGDHGLRGGGADADDVEMVGDFSAHHDDFN